MQNILYVLHSGVTGGTFLTNKDLMNHVEKEYNVFLLTAEFKTFRLFVYSNGELKLLKEYQRNINVNVPITYENKWSAKEFHNSWLTYIYFEVLDKYNIDIVHIRHLINHSFDLPFIAKKLEIPVFLSIHDFYFICPFYVLLDENYDYCEGNCKNNEKNCYCPLNSLNDINSKKFITEWRKNVLDMFSNVDYFITTSDIVKNIFLSIYTDETIINDDNFKVIEHGRDFPKFKNKCYEIPNFDNPIKILCLANHLNIMKGSHIIKSIKQEDISNLLEFHFLGNCHDGIEKYGIDHGTFERDKFHEKVEEIKPSFVGIFSIWPETYCHTLTEAWSCGIPVIGTNIGVVQDRILKNDGGWIIDRNDPKKAYESIIDIANNKNDYLNHINLIKKFKFKDTYSMAYEYMMLYKLFK